MSSATHSMVDGFFPFPRLVIHPLLGLYIATGRCAECGVSFPPPLESQ